jgi:subtilisin
MSQTRQAVIITFKPKDQRTNKKKDKLDILRAEISSPMTFLASENPATLPSGVAAAEVGFDINQYAAPIVTAALTAEEVAALRKNPDIAAIEQDGLMYAAGDPSPAANAPLDGRNGQPVAQAETIPAGIAQINAPAAWDASRGKEIRVAILNSGIDGAHPDLAANYKGGVSFVPGETPVDGNGSGTHAAGIIAAANNGTGIVGVAPAASLYAVKVVSNSGSGNWSWLIAGINWCIVNKMHILNMAVGGGSAPGALETICNAAFANGALLFAGVGHAGVPVPPATSTVGVPARYKNVIGVSAIDNANMIAGFSSRGPEVEVCAPGVNVLSTMRGGTYTSWSGSAAACHHATGAAAVVWGAHRFATNVQIWNLLASTADNVGVPGWDALYGYGRVNVEQAAMALVVPPTVPMRP